MVLLACDINGRRTITTKSVTVFDARYYASAAYVVMRGLCVCACVCLSGS